VIAEGRPPREAYVGLFFVALATLMYEILLTRIFSVTMLYHFAFVALSVAMFGMTVGALLVYLLPAVFTPARYPAWLAAAAIAFPVAMILSFLTELSVPFRIHPSIVALYAMWLVHLLLFRGDGLANWIGLLVVVQNVFTSLFNSHLFDFHEGWMYVIGVGVAGGMVIRARHAEAKVGEAGS